ncbi:hypothetical protein [Pseudooceanicola sp. HF7]|uniref:hypothetical protein n=1 Tax=Pseudooceanicola sp. HF7 TaxID=2721560 RepID=UPI00142FE463|nr:hypothetical protein [Pseudooceanicola sp. HF7]NIZ09752.1 hypothetical protein [Pseudooceanicola sp. HF7]
MTLRWIDLPPQGADPVAAFRLSRPDAHLPEDPWWSALLALEVSLAELQARVEAAFPEMAPGMILPEVHAPDLVVQPGRVVTVFARGPVLEEMNRPGNGLGVSAIQLGAAIAGEHVQQAAPLEEDDQIVLPQETVLMGVIDDGIAIAHELFRSGPAESRVELAYVMESAPDARKRGSYGHVLKRRRIDKLLRRHSRHGLLDEEGFYRAAGVIRMTGEGLEPVSQRRSHGTHVCSLAAGYPPDGSARERPILCAMLPASVTRDVTGRSLEPVLGLAVDRLLHHARRYRLPDGEPVPMVLNFSYGNFGGPHDGTSLIARLIEDRLDRHPALRVVLPAGNGNLAQVHATLSAPQEELRLMARPDDRTASHVQFWLPYQTEREAEALTLRVRPPGGPESPPVQARPGSGAVLVDARGREVARLAYGWHPSPTVRGQIGLSLHPTAALDSAVALAPAGQWQIHAALGGSSPAPVQVWVLREESPPGYRGGGRQAYFDNSCYRRFDALGAPLAVDPAETDCPVRRAGTLSGFATGARPVVVAGLTERNGLLPDYSAAGPITPTRGARSADRKGPDAAARSDDSPALPGVIAAGSRSGSYLRLNGTSMAAPLVARFMADGLARGETVDRTWVAEAAAGSDSTYPGPRPAPSRAGSGRLRIDAPFGVPGSGDP